MFPNFVIIGAQKSASTFVHHCLSEHPEVYIPTAEIPFFETPDFEQHSLAALERLFDGRREKRLGIKRPSYIGKPEVPGRITKHLPDAKLIAILRNPIQRAISAYFHNINYGFIPVADVEDGMRRILNNVYDQKYKRAKEIIEFGFYSKYLKMYGHFFDHNQIFVITYEDFFSDKLASMQKIYDFLDIDSKFLPTALNSRPQKVVYNLPRLWFLRQRNRLMFTYDTALTRMFPKQAGSGEVILARLITVIDRLFLSLIFENNKPNLSAELIGLLYNIYKDEIEELEKFIDRDLSSWKPDIALTGK